MRWVTTWVHTHLGIEDLRHAVESQIALRGHFGRTG
jgi:hypothetical protein